MAVTDVFFAQFRKNDAAEHDFVLSYLTLNF
jgi:hypothetical protein